MQRRNGRVSAGGAVAAVSWLRTNLTVALTTALVASAAGTNSVAGYGTGVRLEYLLIPVIFGLGAPLVALVGTNIGAGQKQRALRIALVGGAIAFAISETLGLVAALWPQAWLALFSSDSRVIETGSAYLRIVGPTYGFFGLGIALYFASQGTARLFWPLVTGFLRVIVAIGGGWLANRFAQLAVRSARLRPCHLRCRTDGGDHIRSDRSFEQC